MTPAPAAGEFTGFPNQTLAFLHGLSEHNEKSWFDAHRADYEAFYLQPALSFIAAMGPLLQREVSPDVRYEAKVNGSLFRIYRDVRFSRNKTPYKDHVDIAFWQGERQGWGTPGFFLRLTGHSLTVGGGLIHITKELLQAYRTAVVDPIRGPLLSQAVAQVEAQPGFSVMGEARPKVPRGFDPNHERARFLRFEGLFAGCEADPPAELAAPAFLGYCLARYKQALPINEWLLQCLPAAGT